MADVIALFNQSGGVGKSTLSMNLGYHVAERGHKVLVVDMDPQGSLTAFMGLEPSDLDVTVYNSLIEEVPLPIHHNIHGMDLVPANIELSGAEVELVLADMRDLRLKESLEPVLQTYQYILIDCPPTLGILSYISLVAATHVLIPIQTEYKALKGTELLLKTITRVKKKANHKLKIAGVVPTMHNNTKQAGMSLQSIESAFADLGPVFDLIPRTTNFANASQAHEPVALYAPNHPAVKVMQKIAQQLENLP